MYMIFLFVSSVIHFLCLECDILCVSRAIHYLYLQCDIFFCVSSVINFFCLECQIFLYLERDVFFCFSTLILFNQTFSVIKYKHVQNIFKRDDLQSRFKFFLTVCRLLVTIKVLVILLVTNLTSNTKNYFF